MPNISPEDLSYMVTLDCFHILSFPYPHPTIGEVIYCRRCQDEREVTDIAGEWRVSCRTVRCPVSRRFGTDERAARRFAFNHLSRYPRHMMSLRLGSKVMATLRYADQQGLFRDTHQSSLRDLVERVAQQSPKG